MTEPTGTAADLVDLIKRKAPEYIDMLTARTEDEFETAFLPLLEKAVTRLEQNSHKFKALDEVGLTAVLAGNLSMPGLHISQEMHSNGHVDITIEADHSTPARRKLGEAKIHDGPAKHIGGLKQLLGRYTTGREGRGLMIDYCRMKDIAGRIRSIRDAMDEMLPCNQQGVTQDFFLKWSFLSAHSHDSGEVLQVTHIGCNLCTD